MQIKYDKKANASYITIRKGRIVKTAELRDRVLVDLDKHGDVLGIEVLGSSTLLKEFGRIKTVEKKIPVTVSV